MNLSEYEFLTSYYPFFVWMLLENRESKYIQANTQYIPRVWDMMDLYNNAVLCSSSDSMRTSTLRILVNFPAASAQTSFMLNGDIMNGMMGRILGENKKNENPRKEENYENRPVKFVMERKNVWRVVWAD